MILLLFCSIFINYFRLGRGLASSRFRAGSGAEPSALSLGFSPRFPPFFPVSPDIFAPGAQSLPARPGGTPPVTSRVASEPTGRKQPIVLWLSVPRGYVSGVGGADALNPAPPRRPRPSRRLLRPTEKSQKRRKRGSADARSRVCAPSAGRGLLRPPVTPARGCLCSPIALERGGNRCPAGTGYALLFPIRILLSVSSL